MAEEGDSVAVHYIGTLEDGTVFDESRPRGSTLDFVIGTGGMIAGFDQGVRGMAVGETKTVRIEPADAYLRTYWRYPDYRPYKRPDS